MQPLTVAVCLLLTLRLPTVSADNVAVRAPTSDVFHDGSRGTCRNATFADFSFSTSYNITHIRVYTSSTTTVTTDSFTGCSYRTIRSPSFVDFFCDSGVKKNRIIIRDLQGSTCEIEVGTCPVGSDGRHYYGSICATPCSDQCSEGLCGSNDGSCSSCPAGKTGPYCSQGDTAPAGCPDDHYGQGCTTLCPTTCSPPPAGGRVCDVASGSCTQPCPAGKQGTQCDQEDTAPAGCPDDHYGQGCTTLCSNTCPPPPAGGRVCDVTYGSCTQPCPGGKRGAQCDQECTSGSYGSGCTSQCTNCASRNCDPVDGRCRGSCNAGYKGPFCNETCAPGTYGPGTSDGCPYQCGHCKDNDCRASDGYCRSGCEPGWKPNYCNTECTSGSYGSGCTSQCTNCASWNCDPVDGRCRGNCNAGYKGPFCNEPCAPGTYGPGTSDGCPHQCVHCKDNDCRANTGYCRRGCEPGWTSNYCNTTCDDGRFGDCGQQCACRNASEVCNKTSGHCQSGCRPGRRGDNCQQDCEDRYFGNCETPCRCRNPSETCDKETGKCRSGCPAGKKGDNCYECQAGRYGADCENTCRCRDPNEACDATSGACQSGCPIGWRGVDCGETPNLDVRQDFNSGLGLGLGVGLGMLLLVLLALLAAFCYWRRLQQRPGEKAQEACQLEERNVYEDVDEERGEDRPPGPPLPDAGASDEEQNAYERIEEAEAGQRVRAVSDAAGGQYESLDPATISAPSASYERLRGTASAGVASPGDYVNRSDVTARVPASSSEYANSA